MISITGVEAVLKANGKAKKETTETIAEGLEKCAEVLLRASQKLVPVDTGALKESGRVVVSGVGAGATAAVVYDTKYAIYVHENLGVFHKPPTQARFLADAIPAVRGTMTNILKRQLTAGVRDGKGNK